MRHHVNWIFFTITNQPHEASKWRFKMALDKTTAAVANLKAAATAILAHCQDHTAELAAVEAADSANAADIQTVADELNAAASPAASSPAQDPAP
jgi:hypothetical protein